MLVFRSKAMHPKRTKETLIPVKFYLSIRSRPKRIRVPKSPLSCSFEKISVTGSPNNFITVSRLADHNNLFFKKNSRSKTMSRINYYHIWIHSKLCARTYIFLLSLWEILFFLQINNPKKQHIHILPKSVLKTSQTEDFTSSTCKKLHRKRDRRRAQHNIWPYRCFFSQTNSNNLHTGWQLCLHNSMIFGPCLLNENASGKLHDQSTRPNLVWTIKDTKNAIDRLINGNVKSGDICLRKLL